VLGPNRDICLYKCISARNLLQMRYDMETVSDLKFITTMKLICLTIYLRTSILQFVNDSYRVNSSEEGFYCNRTIIKINQTPNHRKTRQHLELRPRSRTWYILYHSISCIWISPVPYYLLYHTISCTTVFPVPYYLLYHSISCTVLSPVSQYFLYRTISCTTLFPVPYYLLYHSISCTVLSPVPQYFLYRTISCIIVFPVPYYLLYQYFLYHTIACIIVFPVPYYRLYHSIFCNIVLPVL